MDKITQIPLGVEFYKDMISGEYKALEYRDC